MEKKRVTFIKINNLSFDSKRMKRYYFTVLLCVIEYCITNKCMSNVKNREMKCSPDTGRYFHFYIVKSVCARERKREKIKINVEFMNHEMLSFLNSSCVLSKWF